MKLNRKIIIPAATLLIGLALAGSATSTIAWYQYSTRTNVAYLGTSAGTSGNLQVKIRDYNGIGGDWGTRLEYSDVDTYLSSKKIAPVTTGAMAKDAALPVDDQQALKFYSNPVAGFGPLSQWKRATAANYVVLPLSLRYVERDGVKENSVDDKNIAKDVYLSDLLIQNDYSNAASEKRDLSSAIRVHLSVYQGTDKANAKNFLISNVGGETETVSELDLDGTPGADKDYSQEGAPAGAEYGFGGEYNAPTIKYGEVPGATSTKQVSYAKDDVVVSGAKTNASFASDNTKKLGSTVAGSDSYLNIDVTIWVEGWQKLPKSSTDETLDAIWSADFIGSKFDVGMQFAVQAE